MALRPAGRAGPHRGRESTTTPAGFDPDALVPHLPVDTPERLHHERGLGRRRSCGRWPTWPSSAPEGDGTTVRLVLQQADAR